MATRNCLNLYAPISGKGVYYLATTREKLGLDSTNNPTLDRFLNASSYTLYLTWAQGIAIDYQLPKDATVKPFIPGDPRLRYLSKTQGDTSTGIIVFLPDPLKTDKFMIISPPFSTTQTLSTNPTANYFTNTGGYSFPTRLTNTCFYNTQTQAYIIFGYGTLAGDVTYYGVPATNIVTYSASQNNANEYFTVTDSTDSTITCTYIWMINPGRKYTDQIVIDISGLPNRLSVDGDNRFTYKSQIQTTGLPSGILTVPPPFTIISPPPPISITPGVYSTTDAKNLEIFTIKTGSTFDFTNVTLPQAALTNRSYVITGEQIDFGLFWPSVKILGKYTNPTSFTWNGSDFGPIITDLTGNWLMSLSSASFSTPITIAQSSFNDWAVRYSDSGTDNFYIRLGTTPNSIVVSDTGGGWSNDEGMPSTGTINDKKNIITGRSSRNPSSTFTFTRSYGQLNPAGKTFSSRGNSTLSMTFTDNSNGTYSYYDDISGSSGSSGFTYTLYGNRLTTGAPINMAETNIFNISENELDSTGYTTIQMFKV